MNRSIKKIRNFFDNIKRTISWFPVIWKTNDFDYEYSLAILKYSLERLAAFLESNKTYNENASKSAKEIRLFLKLYDIVYNEKYYIYNDDIIYNTYKEYIESIKKARYKTDKAHSLMWRYFEFHVRDWWD